MKSLWILGALIVLCGCTRTTPSKKPVILASIAPYAFLVESLVGDTASVVTIVPQGANPHVFEPSPRDLASVADARVWVCAGEMFEDKLIRSVKAVAADLRIVDVWQEAELLGGHVCAHHSAHDSFHHEAVDKHVWMSPKNAIRQARSIAQVLIEKFPEHSVLYKNNLSELEENLTRLDIYIQDLLYFKKHTLVLLSHPSLAYFCKDYDLEQLSVEVEGKDPLPQDISRLLGHVMEHDLKKIFTQKGYNNRGAEVIALELGLSTHEIDPYAYDYLNNLRELAQLIASP